MLYVFYGCAYKHRIFRSGVLVTTNDIVNKCYCDLTCDIRDLLADKIMPGILKQYHAFIFTPPCNYYSRANYRRDISPVALETKNILPTCLDYCVRSGKYFLVENVLNKSLLGDLYPNYQFCIGGHTYWSNLITLSDVIDLGYVKQNKQNIASTKRNLNVNVHLVINAFLDKLVNLYV